MMAISFLTMKPFDLEKALAGEPVVTRDGKSIANIEAVICPLGSYIIGEFNGSKFDWLPDGKRIALGESSLDLFMAEKPKVKKEGWVALDSTKDALVSFKIFDNPFRDSSGIFSNCRWAKIEWEEEV